MHFFKNKYIYIYSEKKTAKKNTKKKVLSTLKENRNSVSCVSFSSKKKRELIPHLRPMQSVGIRPRELLSSPFLPGKPTAQWRSPGVVLR